jgi:hypothetical protein
MRIPLLSVALLALLGCQKDNDDGTETGDSALNAPTYFEDIAPILSENCSVCHNPDGLMPGLLFDDAETTSILAGAIQGAVSTGTMPPFFGVESDECENPWGFEDDPRLKPEERDLIAAWAAAGGPTGDIADAVSLPGPKNGSLNDPDMEIFPTGKHTTSAAGAVEDEFICFSIDPGLETQEWLEGFAVIADDLGIVHHVLAGIDHEGTSGTLADPETGIYDCFGGFGDIEATFIGGWIPGASPIEFPAHSGVRMEAGSRIVLQMHYHLVDEPRMDGTGIALRFAEGTPVQPAILTLLGNSGSQTSSGDGLQPGENDLGGDPIFYIPADEEAHTETMRYHPWTGLPRELYSFLIANHMHYVGDDMRVLVERGPNAPSNEDDICLLHTPEWDYAWQQFYKYDASSGNAPVLYPGDALILECTFNNTLSNPALQKALEESGEEEPIDVSLGNGTLDEMCIVVAGWVFEIPVTVEEETHTGTSDTTLTLPGNNTIDCAGPAGFALTSEGEVNGVSACGLDFNGQLITIEYAFSGTVEPATNEAAGTVQIDVLYLDDSLTLDWTGSTDGDKLSLSFSGSGVFSDINVHFDTTVNVDLVTAE